MHLTGNTIILEFSMIAELQWIMEFLLLDILLNIGLLKTHGTLLGENQDILDLREETLVVS
jgi:hypothetical protein